MRDYIVFTPRLPGQGPYGKRARHMVRVGDIPRGRDASGVVHTVTTITGTVLKYRIVACNMPGCYCDAQLVADRANVVKKRAQQTRGHVTTDACRSYGCRECR